KRGAPPADPLPVGIGLPKADLAVKSPDRRCFNFAQPLTGCRIEPRRRGAAHGRVAVEPSARASDRRVVCAVPKKAASERAMKKARRCPPGRSAGKPPGR